MAFPTQAYICTIASGVCTLLVQVVRCVQVSQFSGPAFRIRTDGGPAQYVVDGRHAQPLSAIPVEDTLNATCSMRPASVFGRLGTPGVAQ